jgi:hypothetical protein
MRACSSTDRVSDYGSDGWGFESLQAHETPFNIALSGVFYADINSLTGSAPGCDYVNQ